MGTETGRYRPAGSRAFACARALQACAVALVAIAFGSVDFGGSAVALAQSPAAGVRPSPGEQGWLWPAKLRVSRAQVLRSERKLDVLAPITSRASGEVQVSFRAAGATSEYEVPITSGNAALDRARFKVSLPRSQASLGTGIVTIAYGGDEDTRAQEVRLRAADNPADLEVDRLSLQGDGLSASGRLSSRAEGVVRLRYSYIDASGEAQTFERNVEIDDDGGWQLSGQQVPDDLAQYGGYLSVLFTGFFERRIRGEMISYQLGPGMTRTFRACQDQQPTVIGTSDSDRLRGTEGDDVIMGLGGDDRISAGGGNDIVCGGEGNDRIEGGSGSDVLYGEAGADLLETGGGSSDRAYGGPDGDELIGRSGTGRLSGESGMDWCRNGKSATGCEARRDLTRVPGTTAQTGSGRLYRYQVFIEQGIAIDRTEVAGKIDEVLAGSQGWSRSGRVAFQRVSRDANTRVILATPDRVDALCAPLRTRGRVSCRRGNNVVVNLSRWRYAVGHWPGSVNTYRTMVINHEVGHRIGFGHSRCPKRGARAPVMQQQTYSLQGCRANWWPLAGEIQGL